MKERTDLNKKVADLAIESLKAGNKEDTEKYVCQLEQEGYAIKDLLVDMINGLLTYIGKEHGDDKVTDAWTYASEQFWKPVVENFKTMEHGQVIEIFASLHRGLGSEFRVEQDDEKSTLYVTGCGSGAKLMKEGKYENTDRNPINGGICASEYSCKFCNKDVLPYYCVHGPVMYNILPQKWGWGDQINYDFGRQYDDDGNQVEEPCKLTISRKK